MKKRDLSQISDTGALEKIVRGSYLQTNEKSVEDYKAGKVQAIGYLVGQVMKESKGKANPPMVKELLEKALS